MVFLNLGKKIKFGYEIIRDIYDNNVMEVNENDLDWKLTKKLRHEDPEQFQTLVRMHLSFVLDLNTDE